MDTSSQRQTIESALGGGRPCSDACFDYDNSSHSRRSIDWRDSGIVIDEDNLLFHSFDNICSLDTQSSIWSDSSLRGANQSSRGATNSNSAPRLVLEQDDDGDTILHLAVVGFTLNRVRDLINVCDLNAINNMMQTPLHVAILANRPEMVHVLVEANARMDIHDRRGNTPLHVACQKGMSDIVDILLEAVASTPNKDGNTSLKQIMETCNFDGLTCLHLAAINNHQSIIALLVGKYGAQPAGRDSKSGETILHMAIRQFNVELVEFLLNLREHFNITDFSGRDPLKTIDVLQGSHSTDQIRRMKLAKIKQLIEVRTMECVNRGGCCVIKESASLDTADSSSASSDYSDSDYEMN